MNNPWHYRKRRKDKDARCTSIPITGELNQKYLEQIQEAERKQQAEIRGCISRFTIDNGPTDRQRIFEVIIDDDETEPPHPHSAQ
jgi:hypothetical protein